MGTNTDHKTHWGLLLMRFEHNKAFFYVRQLFLSFLNSFVQLKIRSFALQHRNLVWRVRKWDFFFLQFYCVWAGRSPEKLTEVQGSLLLVAEGKEHSSPSGCANSKNYMTWDSVFLFRRIWFYVDEKWTISVAVSKTFGNKSNTAVIFQSLTRARYFTLK